MSRIRTIKPEFWVSEQIVECSTSARLLFVGMWCFSDDGGVHVASVPKLKMEVFPGDPFDLPTVAQWVEELIRVGLVAQYSVDGVEYWHVTGWKHQKIDRPTIKYPGPEKADVQPAKFDESSTSPRRTLPEPSMSPPPRNGRESKGRDLNTLCDVHRTPSDCTPKKHTYPPGFQRAWAAYPTHANKLRAGRAWKSKRLEPRAEELVLDIERRKLRHRPWLDGFVPHMATYLNGEQWDDDLDEGPGAARNGAAVQFERDVAAQDASLRQWVTDQQAEGEAPQVTLEELARMAAGRGAGR